MSSEDSTISQIVDISLLTQPISVEVSVISPLVTATHVITITDIFNTITTNQIFTSKIETFILPLTTNRTITTSDIPALVLFTMDLIDNIGSFNLSTITLPLLLKMIYEYLVNKYNLFNISDRVVFEEIFLTSVNLAMRLPIKKVENSFVKLFKCCK